MISSSTSSNNCLLTLLSDWQETTNHICLTCDINPKLGMCLSCQVYSCTYIPACVVKSRQKDSVCVFVSVTKIRTILGPLDLYWLVTSHNACQIESRVKCNRMILEFRITYRWTLKSKRKSKWLWAIMNLENGRQRTVAILIHS